MFEPSKKINCTGGCKQLVNTQGIYVIVGGEVFCWPCFEQRQNDGRINIEGLKPFRTTLKQELEEDQLALAMAEAMGGFHHHDHSPGL